MKCYECLSEMIEIDLVNEKGREYHAGVCLVCGRMVTGRKERDVWEGRKVC